MAEAIAQGIGGDLERIVPQKEIASKGFGKFFWGGSQVIMGKTPDIQPIKSNFEDYDLIVVGTPVWAGTYAPAIKTLLSLGLFKNKKLAFFCTHEGGPGKAIEKFQAAVGDNNICVDGIDFLNDKKDVLQHREAAIEWVNKCQTENKR